MVTKKRRVDVESFADEEMPRDYEEQVREVLSVVPKDRWVFLRDILNGDGDANKTNRVGKKFGAVSKRHPKTGRHCLAVRGLA